MDLSLLDRGLWAAGFIEHVALLLILVMKGRWRIFPIFTTLIGFSAVRTVLLFSLYRLGSNQLYAASYWSAEAVDLALQVSLVFEMARVVLKPTGTWVRDARKSFLLFGAVGAVIAAGLSFAVDPGAPSSFGEWLMKGQLFATLLTCELFASMMLASSRLGLVWRNHVMGLGQGITAWAVVVLFMDAAHSYYGSDWHAGGLEHIRIFTYQAATIYWIITFWLSEPESRTLSDDMQIYLSRLQTEMSSQSRGISSPDHPN